MRHAKVVSELADTVRVQFFSATGAAGGQTEVAKPAALHVFGQPVDLLGDHLEPDSWPIIDKLVRAVFSVERTGTFPVRAAMLLLAACSVVQVADVEHIKSSIHC